MPSTIMRGLSRGKLDRWGLKQGPASLKLLVECGLEKLRQDYTHLLLTGELATKECGWVASSLVSQQDILARLESLNTVVEMASSMQTFLFCLPSHQLRSMVHSCLANSGHLGELPHVAVEMIATEVLLLYQDFLFNFREDGYQ